MSQYVGGADNTVPFDQAPSAVVDARILIQKRIKQALNKDQIFNEVLRFVSTSFQDNGWCFDDIHSAAYIERQKMAVGDKHFEQTSNVEKSTVS